MDMFNPYYLDSFAPLDDERNTFKLPVDGKIPEQLTGCYMRNGPNPTEVEVGPYNWMGGDGMVHGLELKGGSATWYRNRWVRTTRLALAFAVPEPSGPADVNPNNVANTNVIKHGGRILALCEIGLPHELTPSWTLSPGTTSAADSTDR